MFNVGTGRATSVNQIADLLASKLMPGMRPEYASLQPGELRYCIADITQAREHLEFEPEGRLEQRVEAIIEWNRKEKSASG